MSDDSQVLHVVALADLRKKIDGIAKVTELDAPELAAVHEAVEEAKVTV